MTHRLEAIFREAAAGRLPPADLEVEVVGAPPGRSAAVCAFTGHNIVAADVDPAEIRSRLAPGDPGAPMEATFLVWLGERLGRKPGMLDAVLVTTGTEGSTDLRPVDAEHPRVARARRYREDVTVYADPDDRALVILGRGLARRWEVSIEIDPAHRNTGLGAELARTARGLVADGEPLFAQASPGNAASVRAFLAADYHPIGSEVLFPER